MREKRARGWVRSTPARIIELRGRMAWSTIVRRRTSWSPLPLAGLRWPAPLACDFVWFHQGRPPRNKGLRFPPDPPTVEEIIAVMRAAGDGPDGIRLRGVIVVLWRAGLRISEALALAESDLDRERGAVLVRHGKGGKRREVGMDRWAWEQLDPWLELRASLPVGVLFCVLRGPTCGRPCAPAGIRVQLRRAASAGRGPSPVRPASAPPRARRRNVPRGCPAARHPAAARTCRPRDHVRATCAGSITPRSSTPSTNARRR